jgi:hypothetical protein
MTDEVFIVVLTDRHTDDDISVHRTKESAEAQVTKHRKLYKDVEWEDDPVEGWELHLVTYDDGPTIRIEKKVMT